MIMSNSENCNTRIVILEMLLCWLTSQNLLWGRNCWDLKVSEEHEEEYFLMFEIPVHGQCLSSAT